MRIGELFPVLHFPWSGNSRCLWGSDLLLAGASGHTQNSQPLSLQPLLCPGVLRAGESKAVCSYCHKQLHLHFCLWLLSGQAALPARSSVCPGHTGRFSASRESRGIFALLLQAGWQWVNGHSSARAGCASAFWGASVSPWLPRTCSLPGRNLSHGIFPQGSHMS